MFLLCSTVNKIRVCKAFRSLISVFIYISQECSTCLRVGFAPFAALDCFYFTLKLHKRLFSIVKVADPPGLRDGRISAGFKLFKNVDFSPVS